MGENIHLSNGTPLCSDFTAASVIADPDRLVRVRAALSSFTDAQPQIDTSESQTNADNESPSYVFSRETLNEAIEVTGDRLSAREFSAVAASLCNAGVANEESTSSGYADYRIHVQNPNGALSVIDQQIVAVASAPSLAHQYGQDEGSSVELVATLPKAVSRQLPTSVNPIRISLRQQILDAKKVVRVANPYFDATEHVLSDLAALPSRGVDLKLLTREVAGNEVNENVVNAIAEIVDRVPPDKRRHLEVADYYQTDERDYQIGAVHAKVVIVDEEKAYLGSANLTQLSLSGNFELGVLVSGEIVHDVIAIFDAMFEYAEKFPT